MNYNSVSLDVADDVATLTLNRPERLNAINRELHDELESALAEAQELDVRALVLTGAGRGFCSGADVTGMAAAREPGDQPVTPDIVRRMRKPTGWLTLLLRNFRRPTIAAVNGVAAGAGLSLALACDIRIAAESARFSAIFVRRAIVPDYGCTYLLPRTVGMARALQMMYSGDIIEAQEALSIGLVSRVTPDETLLPVAQELAAQIAQGPPITIELIKNITYRGVENTLEDQLMLEGHAGSISHSTEDNREGVRSFLEKRSPVFRGK